MNAAGNIGHFIMKNQYLVEGAIVVLLVLLLLLWIINKFVTSRRNREEREYLTAKINKLEKEIKNQRNAVFVEAVQKTEKPAEPDLTKEVSEEANESAEAEKEVAESAAETEKEETADLGEEAEKEVNSDSTANGEDSKEEQVEAAVTVSEDDEAVQKLEEVLFPKKASKKFNSRDWNEDKFGNVYNEDMLKDRIG
ncbi:MAG: hypothetical protein J6H21_02660 [Firmicutes bacterium]|nr:hypothetical protein [Bacillota bacterium]